MNVFERWFFKRVIAREVLQGRDHDKRISGLYAMIRHACEEEFHEDNVPTLNSFLADCFGTTQKSVIVPSQPEDLVKPCPFCGHKVDLEDEDTIYPDAIGWKWNDAIGMRTYHDFRDVPKEQWCYGMHCPVQAGGCGAEIHGDSKEDAIAAWNLRS